MRYVKVDAVLSELDHGAFECGELETTGMPLSPFRDHRNAPI